MKNHIILLLLLWMLLLPIITKNAFADTINSDEIRTVHIIVALCDNKNQGIVPVSKSLGNGQNPRTNLYWGAMYGVKTFFSQSENWVKVECFKPDNNVTLERCIFKHISDPVFIIADAYDGAYIRTAIENFLKELSGQIPDSLVVDSMKLYLGSQSDLVIYVGHNGLMDFDLNNVYSSRDQKQRDAIILACFSKQFFLGYLKNTNSSPLLWTTGLMAPEAYTLDVAIESWIQGESTDTIRIKAATVYSRYQKCSLKSAMRLLVSGF